MYLYLHTHRDIRTHARIHIRVLYISLDLGCIQNDAKNVELEIDIDYEACDEKQNEKKK